MSGRNFCYVVLVNRERRGDGNRFTVKFNRKPVLFTSDLQAHRYLSELCVATPNEGFGAMAASNGWTLKRATKAQLSTGVPCTSAEPTYQEVARG